MQTATKQVLNERAAEPREIRTNDEAVRTNPAIEKIAAENGLENRFIVGPKARVLVLARNRLLREALTRMLSKRGNAEVFGVERESSIPEFLEEGTPCALLLASDGNAAEDIETIRRVKEIAPSFRVVLLGVSEEARIFLYYVRAGISGYLLRDASAEKVVDSVSAALAGEAVCPGSLCAILFQYIEREGSSLPSASIHQQLGLTRREQQLIPLVARGLTNKEIANHFCLSEQTVKNHLYRMKHKVGAEDRLGIVEHCRTQGFIF